MQFHAVSVFLTCFLAFLYHRSPQHEDLQRIANQVVMSPPRNLQDLQKKMESQQATLAELLRVITPNHTDGREMSLPPGGMNPHSPYAMMESGMSVVKDWDAKRELMNRLQGIGGSRLKRRTGKNQASSGKQHQLTKKERYLAVESFWKTMEPFAHLTLLSVPVKKILEVAKSIEEAGGHSGMAESVMEAIRILKRNNSQHACYWRCPCCNLRTYDARGFLDHMATHHETVQYACEDTPLLCTTCAQEVVGAFYYAGEMSQPTAIRCMRCAWESSPPAAPENIPQGWSLHVPREIVVHNAWSDSLGSMDDDSEEEYSDDSGFRWPSDEDEIHDDGSGSLSESSDDSMAVCNCHKKHKSERDALEHRIRNSEDGLLPTIAIRIDALAMEGNAIQFEAAVTSVVQQTQRMMHGALTSLVTNAEGGRSASVSGGNSKERQLAVERLQDKTEYPDQATEIRKALTLLNPSELQDLLALMARKYSPHSQQKRNQPRMDSSSNSESSSKCSSTDSQYEPMCISVFKVCPPESESNRAQREPTIEEPDDSDSEDFETLPEVDENEILVPHSWWVEHLIQKSWLELGTREDLYLLQWVYGNIAHAATNEFLDRQRIACGGKSLDRTIMDVYLEIAETWRHLAATMDRKRHISTLREAVAEDLKAATAFDPQAASSLKKQSDQFHEEVSNDSVLKAVAAGEAEMDAQWSQKALQNLQRFHQLKDEASIRYAQALIDREIAVLELADVMDQHECDVAERELQTVDAALAAAEQDLAEAEAEYLRAQTEGPALHRKRDVLDRVNKEAEHRERLQELQQHISACKERIVSERAFGAGAEERREQAVSDLTEVR